MGSLPRDTAGKRRNTKSYQSDRYHMKHGHVPNLYFLDRRRPIAAGYGGTCIHTALARDDRLGQSAGRSNRDRCPGSRETWAGRWRWPLPARRRRNTRPVRSSCTPALERLEDALVLVRDVVLAMSKTSMRRCRAHGLSRRGGRNEGASAGEAADVDTVDPGARTGLRIVLAQLPAKLFDAAIRGWHFTPTSIS